MNNADALDQIVASTFANVAMDLVASSRRDESAVAVLRLGRLSARAVIERLPEAVQVFILPPSFEALQRRLRGRGDARRRACACAARRARVGCD